MGWGAGKNNGAAFGMNTGQHFKNVIKLDVDDIDEYIDEHGDPQLFDCAEEKIDAIAESILHHGQLQPCTVKKKGDRWELQDGKTRWLAVKRLNDILPENERIKLLCVVGDASTETVMFATNFCRRDKLTPSQRAKTYIRASREDKMTASVIAKLEGCDTDTVNLYLRLENLNEELFSALDNHKLTLKVAIKLATTLREGDQLTLFNFFSSHKLKLTEDDVGRAGEWIGANAGKSFDESTLEKIFEEKITGKKGKDRGVQKKTVSKITAVMSKCLDKNVSEEEMWDMLLSAVEAMDAESLRKMLHGQQ